MRNIRKATLIALFAIAGTSLVGGSASAQGHRPISKAGTPCTELKAVMMEGDHRLVCQQVGSAKEWTEQPIHLQVWRAQEVCGEGVIQIYYGTEIQVGREWRVVPDDGYVALQLHYIGNGAGPDGIWDTIESAAGGEGILRFDVGQGVPTWDLMRVIRTDGSEIASSGREPLQECSKY